MLNQQRKKQAQAAAQSQAANGMIDSRQLNLAEMVRGANMIKQNSNFSKKDGYPPNPQLSAAGAALAAAANADFIKGTQMQKNFELVAEPLLQKQSTVGASSNSQNGTKNTQQAASSSSSQITYSNTAISTIQGGDKISDQGSGLGTTGSANHYSQNSSRKNLESYYSTVNSKANAVQFQTQQDGGQPTQSNNIQHIIQGHTAAQNPQYSTNRSVAAKAGQMQIFSTDKYSHLSSNNSTQNTKFQSPSKNLQANGKLHHQSASQQIENMMDLQQMRLRNSSGQQNNNNQNTQKYADYLNRFSTSHSIDQTQNLQLKYRDLRNQMLDQDPQYFQPEQLSSAGGPEYVPDNIPQTQNFKEGNKRSPVVQKENRVEGFGLGISGESMHLEEKTFLKKMGGVIGQSIDGGGGPQPMMINGGGISQRHAGSSRKRQDLSVNARGINRGYKPGIDSQHLAIQPRTRYDYVFIRITEDNFDKEFGEKIMFTRETNEQSPSVMSFKNKRISSMATNSAKKEEANNVQQSVALMPKHQASLRGSQELLKDTTPNYFSPLNKHLPSQGMDELISIQNIDQKYTQPPTPKIMPTTCSIISTNHTHIKVITHQGVMSMFGDLSPEQTVQHYIALNETPLGPKKLASSLHQLCRGMNSAGSFSFIQNLNSIQQYRLRILRIQRSLGSSSIDYLKSLNFNQPYFGSRGLGRDSTEYFPSIPQP